MNSLIFFMLDSSLLNLSILNTKILMILFKGLEMADVLEIT